MRIFVWKNRWEKSSYAEYNDPIKIKFYIILVKSYVTFQARKIEPIFTQYFFIHFTKKKKNWHMNLSSLNISPVSKNICIVRFIERISLLIVLN